MRWYKIKALMFRDFKIITRCKFRLVELFYFPLTTILIWGLFSIFTRNISVETGIMVLAVNIFWSFAHLSQFTTNIQINQDFWSGSFRQVMASGFTRFEYMFARIVSSTVSSAAIMVYMLLIASIFGLTIFFEQPGMTLALSGITLIGSMALAITVTALILFLGREYAFLAWTLLEGFILLSAPVYPVDVFPEALQHLAQVMPFTNIFAGVREMISFGTLNPAFLVNGLVIAIAYLIISIPLYHFSFKRAKGNGTLSRMD
ncbi:MAG: ABC transporter permease [Candidatus Aenigmarchaeota archaeon]|nr:ABC transporter permease [Candidatus Aenigmarchaeota archaeon]